MVHLLKPLLVTNFPCADLFSPATLCNRFLVLVRFLFSLLVVYCLLFYFLPCVCKMIMTVGSLKKLMTNFFRTDQFCRTLHIHRFRGNRPMSFLWKLVVINSLKWKCTHRVDKNTK